MHHFTNLSTLHYQGRLDALAYAYQVMVYGAYCQQRGDGSMLGIDIPVGEYDIADAVVNALLCLMAQILQGVSQSALTTVHGEQDR